LAASASSRVAIPRRPAPVTLGVHFKLTDLDYRPVPNAPVRVALGSDPDWQNASSGYRCMTSTTGECAFIASAAIDRRDENMPTNYIDSLFSLVQAH
jgi:hypothetical protein